MNATTQLATTDDTRQHQPEIVKFRSQLEQRANELKMALPSHISPEKFQRTILTAAQGDPSLLEADRQSLILACMRAAQDGLLPDKREAAIVVFKENKKIGGNWQTKLVATYLPMVYGLRKKILQSGDVIALEVGVVYRKELEQGDFYYRVGVEPPLGHKPSFDLTLEDTTDDKIVAAYSIATMKDGTKSYEVMRRFEIDKVREASMTGATRTKKGEPRQPSGPWVEWFPEQAKKTVMRRHSKVLPMSGDLIIDVEGRDLDAGLSTVNLLSAPAPEPTMIEDRSDEVPHDRETGEITDQTVEVSAQSVDSGEATAEEAEALEEGELSPSEKAANAWMAAFDKAETLIDLKELHGQSEMDRSMFDDDLREAVEKSYDDNTLRLKPAPAAKAVKAEA